MAQSVKIIVTGAAGFIGSVLVGYLNSLGYEDLILVDTFDDPDKRANWSEKKFTEIVEKEFLERWLGEHPEKIDCIFHMGANSSTTEFNYEIHKKWNLEYTQMLWKYCTEKNIPLIYASSAATYGDGELGYSDDHEVPFSLQPLNPYGISKNEFDKWALQQPENEKPTFWAGLKFFNVYGPNEHHKGRMASVILHSFHQIQKNGEVKLFRSHRPDYKDGEQLRDFVYVIDLVKVMVWMMLRYFDNNPIPDGLYNIGTGHARSFYDLADNTFKGMDIPSNIQFIDMPVDIRDKYQYFTEAKMDKLRNAGYNDPFYSLEEGIEDYVKNYLLTNKIY
ncbi:MAG: ADP-glyceromanno-heptose 6-epimerase [Pseudopedobacter saltans]|uniref:ADP-L-glycero-D-manno-heptose-6-epimerase n=1 Tax=Pseudopedobacter saltans TaxID=151895 RepID=A0A2W5H5X0_9SPHI|nr:MAG: ADP-glyceromanno-heptose 6-epimerase [Pseudopedobacter saltans]